MLKVTINEFSYPNTPEVSVLKDIVFSLKEGEHLAVLGESGCGKSTLLKLIYGLYDLDEGQIFWNNTEVLGPKFYLIPGMPFMKYLAQDFDLMPFITVGENVGKFLSNFYPKEKQDRIDELLNLVEMSEFKHIKAKFLSGGQMQRVALARALAIEPRMLLLDEPFGALDAKVRKELRQGLRDIHDNTGLTTIFVTHDQGEAMAIADRIALLNEGRMEQVGTPEELYRNPKTLFVADFLGNPNVVEALVVGLEGSTARLELAGFPLRARAMGALVPGRLAKLVLRPEALRPAGVGEVNALEGALAHSLYLGSHYEHWVRVGDALLRFYSPLPLGEARVRLAVDPEAALAYPG